MAKAPANKPSGPETPVTGTAFASHPGVLARLLTSLGGSGSLDESLHGLLLLDPAMAVHMLQLVGNHRPGALLADLRLDEVLRDLDAGASKQLVITAAIAQLADPGLAGKQPDLAWGRALASAHLCRLLAERSGYPGRDEAWLAGLMTHLPQFVRGRATPETARSACIVHLERLPLRTFLPDVLRYLDESAERLLDAAPLVRLAIAAHRLTGPPGDTIAPTSDGVFLARPVDQETIKGMLQNTNQAVEAILGQYGTSQAGDMAAELMRFGRLEIAAGALREGPEASIAALADSLASQEGLFDPVYLQLNKRTSILEAMPIGGRPTQPIHIRVEGSNTAAVRALFTRNCVVVFYDDADASVLDLQLMHQADADGLAAIPVGEGEQRGVMLVCGDQDVLEEISANPKHYARLGAVVGHSPSVDQAIIEAAHDDRSDALPTRVRRAAHEVNNPLGIIKNYLAILKVKLGEDAPISDELRIIYEELDRIVRIVRSLTHEDMELGELSQHSDVNALITDLVKVTAPTWHAKGLQVLTQLTPGLPRLSCDRDKLKQIVLNLLLNALEATPQGGVLRIETAAVTNHRQEQFVEITVADSGPGIPPERAAQLFNPVESEKGGVHAGLGLSIVKTLTESLNGVISFKSNISGTTFQISLPLG